MKSMINGKGIFKELCQNIWSECSNTESILNKCCTEIFLGYSTRHVTNVYIIFNITTKSISISHDIYCLNITYLMWKFLVKGSIITN